VKYGIGKIIKIGENRNFHVVSFYTASAPDKSDWKCGELSV